jgi:integrase/recombinase XerD
MVIEIVDSREKVEDFLPQLDGMITVDINTIRGWLGHVSLRTTNIYAEIDLEMKAKALGKCEVTERPQQHKHWRDQPALMEFLRTL